ncbi:MAG: phosphate ABC transporter ATP-binding protein PstB [Gemmatimonadaceae bacterium]
MTPLPKAGFVELRDFTAWFASNQALRNVSVTFAPGSVTALIGPSGCGKTTLLRATNRLNDLITEFRSEGLILLDGENIYARGVDTSLLRQRVGMVFQRSNPFPRSVYENVAYGPRLNGFSRGAELDAVVEQSLRRASLWDEVKDRLREPALTLSGGQQQRLCIARALANEPDVLLLDEPGSALDPANTQRIEELLYELKRDLCIVIVTHNLQQAARVSDNTVFLYQGALVEMNATRDLFTSPREPQTEAFITGRFG